MPGFKRLIPSHDNSIEPKGAIGKQKCGIIFWQKTGFLRHCNTLGFKAIIQLITKEYLPTRIEMQGEQTVFLTFDNDNDKLIYLTLENEKDSKKLYIYGESHTAYTDAKFHIFALKVVEYISKQIGTKFYVDDATDFLSHGKNFELEKYIHEYQEWYRKNADPNWKTNYSWKYETAGTKDNVVLFGVKIFDHMWRDTGKTAKITTYPLGEHDIPINTVCIDGKECEFAVEEQSNGVYVFFVFKL